MFKRLLLFKQFPLCPNLGLLALRMLVFLPVFMKHGIEKLFTFNHMAQNFLDPVGIGPVPTLAIAMIADGVCSLLIVAGLGTRWAAFYSLCNLFAAWAIPHHFVLLEHSPAGAAGEAIFAYMAACVVLILNGSGKFSIDALIDGAWKAKKDLSKNSSVIPV
jgi:putative oxidoreductase